jgi:hypothetical protein
MSEEPRKKVRMTLVGLDGNAYFLMGSFSKEARRQGWTKEQIDNVLTDCRSSDYDHLLCVLMENIEEPDGDEYEEEDDC